MAAEYGGSEAITQQNDWIPERLWWKYNAGGAVAPDRKLVGYLRNATGSDSCPNHQLGT